MVAVLVAMPSELRPFVRAASLRRGAKEDRHRYTGMIGDVSVVAAAVGMGTENAARVTADVLDLFEVEHVIGVGVVGGVDPTLEIGDLVVPELVIDGATLVEYLPTPVPGFPVAGTLLTTDEFLSGAEVYAELVTRGITALDMESSAIGAACDGRGIPWTVIRAVSDRASDGLVDEAILHLNKANGHPDLVAVAKFVMTKPRRVPHLARLGRDLGIATRASAHAALRACARLGAG